MIFLTCGTPGAGKTLWTLAHVEARRVKESRTVYQSGVEGLRLGWETLENPQDWHALPDGAIIVIDECQRVFPVRKQGVAVPAYVSAFETHRHRGLDIYLVTQDPLLIDAHVRKLVGEFRFLNRPFGQEYAVVWRFSHVCDWRSSVDRQTAVKSRWKFPAGIMQAYKSAEVHTHKKSVPKYLLYGPVLAALVGLCVWGVYWTLSHFGEKAPAKAVAIATVGAEGGAAAEPAKMTPLERWKARGNEVLAYSYEHLPLLPDVPESAPVYRELAKPTVFPVVSGCVVSRKGCSCYTQQGTPVDVTDSFCLQFVQFGQFNPYAVRARSDRAVRADDRAPAEPDHLAARAEVDADSLPVRQRSATGAGVSKLIPAKPGL
jgi:hypothetical protein